MTRLIIIYFLLIFGFCPALHAQQRRVQNRPYIDQRRLHYGFLIGIQEQDLEFTNNARITEDGECWYAEVTEYNPGFEVGVLAELYRDIAAKIYARPEIDLHNLSYRLEIQRRAIQQLSPLRHGRRGSDFRSHKQEQPGFKDKKGRLHD